MSDPNLSAYLEKLSLEEEYSQKLMELDTDNTEESHAQADDLLCELLVKLGYSKVAEEYKKIDKWYS